MQMWTRLGSWFARQGPGRAVLAQQEAFTDPSDELPAEPERPWGCGWFDSSLDLRQGLAVIEHRGIDLGLALDMMLAPEATRH